MPKDGEKTARIAHHRDVITALGCRGGRSWRLGWPRARAVFDQRRLGLRRPLEDALQLIRKVADALGYAHERGIVYRDITPAIISNDSVVDAFPTDRLLLPVLERR